MTYPVQVYVYDLAMGMASTFSSMVGVPLDGIWHTAVVVHNHEVFFGGGGIQMCPPGGTMLGPPLRKVDVGSTSIDLRTFKEYLENLESDRFAGAKYHLLRHNCNNFSEEVCRFLTGNGIPSYILELPQRVMGSPIVNMLLPLIESATPSGSQDYHTMSDNDSAQSIASPAKGSSAKPTPPKAASSHFPLRKEDLICLDKEIEVDKASAKLMELAAKNGGAWTEKNTGDVVALMQDKTQMSSDVWNAIKQAIRTWPSEDLFPLLDTLRVVAAVTRKNAISKPLDGEVLDVVVKELLKPDTNATAIALTLKIVSNLMGNTHCLEVVLAKREDIVSKINTVVEEVDEGLLSANLQTSIATTMLNLTVLSTFKNNHEDMETKLEAAFQMVSSLASNLLQRLSHPEALYRCVVSMATLVSVSDDGQVRDLAKALDVETTLNKIAASPAAKSEEKLVECVRDLKKALV